MRLSGGGATDLVTTIPRVRRQTTRDCEAQYQHVAENKRSAKTTPPSTVASRRLKRTRCISSPLESVVRLRSATLWQRLCSQDNVTPPESSGLRTDNRRA